MLSRRPSIAFLFLLLGLLLAGSAILSARAETESTRLQLGTATKGGGFQLFGHHLVEVINDADSTLYVEAVATKGSRENLPLLEEDRIDLGLVEGNAARQALDGMGRDPADLRVLSVMYPNPGMFVVRGDSRYQSIADLKGRRVAFGTRASGLRILARDVLDGLSLKPERDFEQVILDRSADGPRLVLTHEVEALWGAGIGWPGFVKVAEGREGARFIAPKAREVRQILSKHPHLKPMSVPAGTYRGQARQIDSVGLWSLILVRPDFPADVVYRLARAIHRGESALAQRLDQGRYTTSRSTAQQVPRARLHAGTLQYLHEIGLTP